MPTNNLSIKTRPTSGSTAPLQFDDSVMIKSIGAQPRQAKPKSAKMMGSMTFIPLVKVDMTGEPKKLTNEERERRRQELLKERALYKEYEFGPNLRLPTQYDKEAVYAASRERVKELAQRFRQNVKKPQQVVVAKPKTAKKKPLEKSDSETVRSAQNVNLAFENRLQKQNKSLTKLLAPSEADLLSGEVGYDDEIVALMKEGELKVESIVNLHVNPIIGASIRMPNRGAGETEDSKAPISLNDISIYKSSASSFSALPRSAQKKCPSDIQLDAEEVEEEASISEFEIVKYTFLNDFEQMLDWQGKLENQAFSLLGGLEDYSKPEIYHYKRDDIMILAYNIIAYLRKMTEYLIPNDTSNTIFNIIGKQDRETVLDLKDFINTIPQKQFVELKAYCGHVKRIVFASHEDRISMKILLRNLSNLLGPLMFSPFARVVESYLSPKIDLKMVSVWNSLADVKETLPSRPVSPKKISSTNSLFLSGMEERSRPDEELYLSQQLPSLGTSQQVLEPIEEDQDRPRSRIVNPRIPSAAYKSAITVEIIENNYDSEKDLRDSFENLTTTHLHLTLFDEQLPLNWHANAVDLLVRYWDYIFSNFETES